VRKRARDGSKEGASCLTHMGGGVSARKECTVKEEETFVARKIKLDFLSANVRTLLGNVINIKKLVCGGGDLSKEKN